MPDAIGGVSLARGLTDAERASLQALVEEAAALRQLVAEGQLALIKSLVMGPYLCIYQGAEYGYFVVGRNIDEIGHLRDRPDTEDDIRRYLDPNFNLGIVPRVSSAIQAWIIEASA